MTKPTTPLPDYVSLAIRNLEYDINKTSTICESFVEVQESDVHELIAHIQAQAERIAALEELVVEKSRVANGYCDALHAAEAEFALVSEWARGRCECCGYNLMQYKIEACGLCIDGLNWTPAWGKGE